MIQRMFKSRFVKITAVYLAFSILFQCIYPTVALALTNGPSQPEVQKMTPANVSDMVDLFTGDFNYNIPLLDIDGYPINISYNSNVSMDDEASWVGLGWSLNPGSINRTVRGLPDDYDGDEISRDYNIKEQSVFGGSVGGSLEIFGKSPFGASASVGLSHSNYNGYSFTLGGGLTATASAGKMSATSGIGFSLGSESGLSLQPSLSFSAKVMEKDNASYSATCGFSSSYNSLQGYQSMTMSASTGSSVNVSSTTTPKMVGYSDFSSSVSLNSFATPTYTPKSDMDLQNNSYSMTVKIGGTAVGVFGSPFVTLNYSSQSLLNRHRSDKAYGYIYQQDASSGKSVLDFNREKDGPYNSTTRPNLPIASNTYDIFSVAGQGVGGTYRFKRSDVGLLRDCSSNLSSVSNISAQLELGGGWIVHGGGSVAFDYVTSDNGAWNDPVIGRFGFNSNTATGQVYLKQEGELSVDSNISKYTGFSEDLPVSFQLAGQRLSGQLEKFKNGESNGTSSIPSGRYSKPQVRAQNVSYLTANEASIAGVDKKIKSYALGDYTNYSSTATVEERVTSTRKGHHISEINVTRKDGARYVYGLPVYNTNKEEITFALNASCTPSGNFVKYSADLVNNKKGGGKDQYYNDVKTGAYAYAYLLTAVLSDDYVDLTGDGPTPDDLGTYTRFNYTKVSDNYQWRNPYSQNTANYNPGLNTYNLTKESDADDKGSFVYGHKEVWHLHSIETRDKIADFIISKRLDGKGVSNIHGGINYDASANSYKLDEIKLYSRESKKDPNAKPIKSVHFVYDYSLCAKVPNNENFATNKTESLGKLTLSSIYFTYNESGKDRLSPYVFNYGQTTESYSQEYYDRWGNFKNPNEVDSYLQNNEFPYSTQKKKYADTWAKLWRLSQVLLPTGGAINVDYEADTYAYVQDKTAMQMFFVEGTGTSNSSSLVNLSASIDGDHTYLFFKLKDSIPVGLSSVTQDQKMRKYVENIDKLYFKFKINTTNGVAEWVPGYCDIDVNNVGVNKGIIENGKYTYGYVKIKNTGLEYNKDNGSHNPIQKAGWQFSRMNTPQETMGKGDYPEGSSFGMSQVLGVVASIGAAFEQLASFTMGPNNFLETKGWCKTYVKGSAFIRLNVPDGVKFGGGSRVSKIVISDEWDRLTNQSNLTKSYGYTYDYSIKDPSYKALGYDSISSGVATYEPIVGNEENPFRQPIVTPKSSNLLAPGVFQYQEYPFCESYFPAASVGYRQVTVRSLASSAVEKQTHGTGEIVHTFYTAKDYPTVLGMTSPQSERQKFNPMNILKFRAEDFTAVSQGYVVELNDMHGKKAKEEVLSQSGDLISYQQFNYNVGNDKKFKHDLPVMIPKLDSVLLDTVKLGLDYDYALDMKESNSSTTTLGVSVNMDGFLAFIFPAVVPTVLPSYYLNKTRFRSASFTKVIKHTSVVDSITKYDLGSTVSMKNIAYDRFTGDVLLTKTTNEFNKPVYTFKYPAYWSYEGMSPVCFKEGTSNKLSEGDKVLYNSKVLWYQNGKLIDETGTVIDANPTGSNYKIIRPSERNKLSDDISTVTFIEDPIVKINGKNKFIPSKVISSSAVEYSTRSSLYCLKGSIEPCSTTFNPYFYGLSLNWKPFHTFYYTGTRNYEGSLKEKGYYSDFNSFWSVPESLRAAKNWRLSNKVTLYDPFGSELENQDALNIFSSVQYNFNNVSPTLVVKNAQYRNIGFDSFEDYKVASGNNNHFNFRGNSQGEENFSDNVVVNSQSHSGRKCIKVQAKKRVVMTKAIEK